MTRANYILFLKLSCFIGGSQFLFFSILDVSYTMADLVVFEELTAREVAKSFLRALVMIPSGVGMFAAVKELAG